LYNVGQKPGLPWLPALSAGLIKNKQKKIGAEYCLHCCMCPFIYLSNSSYFFTVMKRVVDYAPA